MPGIGRLTMVLAGAGVMTSAAFTGRTSNTANSLSALATFPTYPQAVAADSPQAYYRADDPVGSLMAADSSGNGRTGNYVGASGFQQSGSPAGGSGAGANTATQFPGTAGTGAYSAASLANPSALTIEVWFRTTTTTGGKLIGLGNLQTGNSNTYDRHVWMSNDGKLHSGCYPGSVKIVDSTAAYNDNAWHLVTASFGAAGMVLYVDGVSVGSLPGTTTCQSYTGYVRLGGDAIGTWTPTPTSPYFSGRLDEAAVLTTQLSAARVSAHHSAGVGAGTPAAWTPAVTADAPWALWHLDDPAPTRAALLSASV